MFKFVVLVAVVASANAGVLHAPTVLSAATGYAVAPASSIAVGPALGATLLGKTTINAPETTIVKQQVVVDQPEYRYRAVPTIVQAAPIVQQVQLAKTVVAAPQLTYAAPAIAKTVVAAPAPVAVAAPAPVALAAPAIAKTVVAAPQLTYAAPAIAKTIVAAPQLTYAAPAIAKTVVAAPQLTYAAPAIAKTVVAAPAPVALAAPAIAKTVVAAPQLAYAAPAYSYGYGYAAAGNSIQTVATPFAVGSQLVAGIGSQTLLASPTSTLLLKK